MGAFIPIFIWLIFVRYFVPRIFGKQSRETAVNEEFNTVAATAEQAQRLALTCCELGEYQRALNLFDQAILAEPKAHFYNNRSICRSQIGDGVGALVDQLKALNMAPKNTTLKVNLAVAWNDCLNMDESFVCISRARCNGPDGFPIRESFEMEKKQLCSRIIPASSIDWLNLFGHNALN